MAKTLWYFNKNFFKSYTVKEVEVIKETDKQYIVQEGGWRRTVRKSCMENFNDRFYLTKEECDKGVIAYAKLEIYSAKNKIRYLEEKIGELKTYLKESYNVTI